MREPSPRTLDRLLAGELTRAEERRLAQAALTAPELFDALTAASVARTALGPPSGDARPGTSPAEPRVHAFPRRSTTRIALVAALAAAAVLVLAVRYGRRTNGPSPAPPAPHATTAATAVVTAPILLARADVSAREAFRADAAPSRPPKDAGVVVEAHHGSVDVDLGSLDGLQQGVQLQVSRDGRPIGRLTVTTVFRDRARGRAGAGVAVRGGDRVEVDPAMLAVARLEHAEALNELGVAQTDRHDLAVATRTFDSALEFATGVTRVRVTNNLGAVAALRGDRAEAERRYRQADALAAASSELTAERQTIGRNLSALQPSR